MANPGCLKGTRVLKVVFGYRCPHRCDYCAVKNSSRYGEWENLLLDPLKAAPLIEKAAERYTFSGIEIGAGESFLHPDLFRWIVDLNNRRPQVPLFLFASPGTPGAEEVVEIMETSETPVYMLVSADGPLSERNRGNWPETVDHFRWLHSRAQRSGGKLHVKLAACLTPENGGALLENFKALLELDPTSPFTFRPIKREYSEETLEAILRGYRDFLLWAEEMGRDLWELSRQRGSVLSSLRGDWSCAGSGLTLLPNGRWTDCYVTHYCSDHDPARSVGSLEEYEGFFRENFLPRQERCQGCLDLLSFCNLCQAGLADYRRSTGREFYTPDFCLFINRLSLLSLWASLRRYPELRWVLSRQGADPLALFREGESLKILKAGKPYRSIPFEKILSADGFPL